VKNSRRDINALSVMARHSLSGQTCRASAGCPAQAL
jgi:hypothetical protein